MNLLDGNGFCDAISAPEKRDNGLKSHPITYRGGGYWLL